MLVIRDSYPAQVPLGMRCRDRGLQSTHLIEIQTPFDPLQYAAAVAAVNSVDIGGHRDRTGAPAPTTPGIDGNGAVRPSHVQQMSPH